jgi:hypothetical protein
MFALIAVLTSSRSHQSKRSLVVLGLLSGPAPRASYSADQYIQFFVTLYTQSVRKAMCKVPQHYRSILVISIGSFNMITVLPSEDAS